MLHLPGTRSVARQRVAFATCAIATFLLGCSDAELRSHVARNEAAVTGGDVSDATDDGVVYLGMEAEFRRCSGALVAPNLVLTAAHCVSDFDDEKAVFSCSTADGSGTGSYQIGDTLPPSDIAIYTGAVLVSTKAARGKQIFSSNTKTICQKDIALVLLDRDLDLPLVPLSLDRRPMEAELTRAVGYGYTSNADTTNNTRHVRHDIPISFVGADSTHTGSPLAAPYTVVIPKGPCRGDSGGPLLTEETNAALGVYSINPTRDCDGTGIKNIYTQIAPFSALIDQAFEAAGHEPVREVVAGTGGTSGATGSGGTAGDPGSSGQGGDEQLGEGGAALGGSSNGTGGSGGSSDASGTGGGTTGGSGGSGASAATGGDDASGGTSTGSGSRRDPSCACRTSGSERSPTSTLGWLLGALLIRSRRRSRAR